MGNILIISNHADEMWSVAKAAVLAAQRMGWVPHLAVCFDGADREALTQEAAACGVTLHRIPLARKPLAMRNVQALRSVVCIIREERIDGIHCITPAAGLLGRIAGRWCRVPLVLYQAQCLPFSRGGPLRNWLLDYPAEKALARWTDVLITGNAEDDALASRRLRPRRAVVRVPGVVVDLTQFSSTYIAREQVRRSMGLDQTDFLMVTSGRLEKRMDVRTLINALALTCDGRCHLAVCGDGPLRARLAAQARRLGVGGRVHFMGVRRDMAAVYAASDCFVQASLRDDLPRAAAEAMACGLPCVTTRIRSHADLIDDGEGGFLTDPELPMTMAGAIRRLMADPALCAAMGAHNREKVSACGLERAAEALAAVYRGEYEEVEHDDLDADAQDLYGRAVGRGLAGGGDGGALPRDPDG